MHGRAAGGRQRHWCWLSHSLFFSLSLSTSPALHTQQPLRTTHATNTCLSTTRSADPKRAPTANSKRASERASLPTPPNPSRAPHSHARALLCSPSSQPAMSSGTIERPTEPMLGVDESKDINAFYHNTAYRVRWFGARAAIAAGADGDDADGPRSRDARSLPFSFSLSLSRAPPSLAPRCPTPLTGSPNPSPNRRAASPSTSRR